MFELIYCGLFLLLYGFGAWMFFNGLRDYTNASKASKPQPSASQFDIGNMKPGTVCTANCLDDDGEIDSDVPSHNEPGVTEIANEERLRIEQEHRSIPEDVLQGVLTEQPTSFDAIYEKYSSNCTSRELKKKLDKPRGRYSVKQYLREMENEGKLKRVMNVREYFYVVAEEESGEIVTEGEQHRVENVTISEHHL
jgi:hypothetical protein